MDKIKVGDWVVFDSNRYGGDAFTKGNLYKCANVADTYGELCVMVKTDNVGSQTNGHNIDFFRKATPTEITNHLNMNMKQQEIDYYEVIKQYPHGLPIGSRIEVYTYTIEPSLRLEPAKYPEFFKPIYKSKAEHFSISCKSGNFGVEISGGEFDKVAKFDGATWTISELRELVSIPNLTLHDYKISFNLASVNVGCKKGISIESLKSLIDKLEPLPF